MADLAGVATNHKGKIMSHYEPQAIDSDEDAEQLTIIPTSVIDIEPQKKRIGENHGTTSSRANYSPFPKEITTLCYEFYLRDSHDIFDPFAGWGERHRGALDHGFNYVGFDISSVAIAKAKANYEVRNYLADSSTASIPAFDGLLTCPPYWNLEKYEAANGLDRAKTWPIFVTALEKVFLRCYETALPGTTFCIMAGDWRFKAVYYDLEYEISGMFKEFGAQIVDKVIVSRKKISKIKIMLPQCKRLGYSIRVHESLLVFRKQ